MTPDEHALAAAALRQAEGGDFLSPLRDRYPGMSARDAYAVQDLNTQHREAAGQRIIGCKVGLTSVSVQKQLGVDQPDFGMLFDVMNFGDGEAIPWARLQQPKVEAEIAFVFGRDLSMSNPGHVDVISAVEYLLPAIEVVGSRIDKWNIKLVDTIADNASSSAFVLGGTPRRMGDLDLRLCGMVLERLGEPVSTGAGVACLGHPVNAVVWLARTMAALGRPMRAGDLVLSGALGPMVAVEPGDTLTARINGLGSVAAVFAPQDSEAAQ